MEGNKRGPRPGHKASDKTKQLLSLSKLGKSHPRYSGTYVTPQGKFDSVKRACEAHGIKNRNVLVMRCKRGNYKGWYFMPKDK